MNTRSKDYAKDNQAAARSRAADESIRPLSLPEMERVVRACFALPNQAEQRGDRGEQG